MRSGVSWWRSIAARSSFPDKEARSALGRAAEGYDEASGYERIVAVHDAHHALLSVLG